MIHGTREVSMDSEFFRYSNSYLLILNVLAKIILCAEKHTGYRISMLYVNQFTQYGVKYINP